MVKQGKLNNTVIWTISIAFSLFHIYTALFGIFTNMVQGSVHLFSLAMLAFLIYRVDMSKKEGRTPWYDFIFFLFVMVVGIYFISRLTPELILDRGISGITQLERWMGLALLIIVLEGTRRTVGLPIVMVAVAFLIYALFGPYMPRFISHKGYSIWRLVDNLAWTTQGIFGIPIAVSSTFVIIFILFGAFLDKLGAGSFFINMAYSLSGHRRGGPALTAVMSSAFMGSISGSAVSNVVTTGAFTIPLMKKTGYRPDYAAAVEAVASTGGQIMPPVMGAVAFVMADMTGVSYSLVALSAAIPALLYFISIGFMVYFEACKMGLQGIPKSKLPNFKKVFAEGFYVFLPIGTLIYLLFIKRLSPMRSGIFTIIILIAISLLWNYFKKREIVLRKLIEALKYGASIAVPVAMACASAGIVIGIVSLTGLGVRFTQMIITISGGNLFLALLLTMLACLILGMGLPTTAAYIITSVLAAPALTSMGVPLIAAHLFILYFAIISFITPPVAISAFAASGIAGSNSMKTGFLAFRLGIAGFIVPFMFVYSPAMVLVGPWWLILLASGRALIAVFSLASFLEGWLNTKLSVPMRAALGVGIALLIFPGLWSGIAGSAIAAVVILSRVLQKEKGKSPL